MLRTTRSLATAVLGAASLTPTTSADVDVEFRVLDAPPIVVGDEVRVGLYLTSTVPDTELPVAAVEIVFEWESESLELIGLDTTGGAVIGFGGFILNGSSGLNESDPPTDGDGLYYAFAQFGTPIPAASGSSLLTTFVFQTIAIDPEAEVRLPESAGVPPRMTIVFDGVIPNTDITGALTSTTVQVLSDCGPADCNQDGVLNVDDVDCFVAGFLVGDLAIADCNGDSTLNVDDVDCFVASFLSGCP